LKPSNIIVAENGHVKVLDFGIAKLSETATGEFEESATMGASDPTITEEGAIVGTVAYMSPEQVEGKKVDGRSDIFSLGSMLYEMVTGSQAFHGDSKMSTLSAILNEDPKPVSSLVADIPRDLEKLIVRCLRKDPNRRYQTMADLKVALQELREESESGKLTGITSELMPPRRQSPWIWALGGTAVVFPLTGFPGSQINPAFSPDGKQVAFSWDGEKSDISTSMSSSWMPALRLD
jgi:serine/threonine protein kinase